MHTPSFRSDLSTLLQYLPAGSELSLIRGEDLDTYRVVLPVEGGGQRMTTFTAPASNPMLAHLLLVSFLFRPQLLEASARGTEHEEALSAVSNEAHSRPQNLDLAAAFAFGLYLGLDSRRLSATTHQGANTGLLPSRAEYCSGARRPARCGLWQQPGHKREGRRALPLVAGRGQRHEGDELHVEAGDLAQNRSRGFEASPTPLPGRGYCWSSLCRHGL